MKLGLLMMVKDEESVIKRAIDSVNVLTDYWLILDTGSTDTTKEIITETLKDKEGKIIEHDFVNFGVSKSLLFSKAFEIKEVDYWFFLDADEVFLKKNHEPLNISDRENLEKFLETNQDTNVVYFMTHYSTLNYRRWQIVKNDQLYRWDYPAHEILVAVNGEKSVLYEPIINMARKEGNGSKDPNRNMKYVNWFKEYLAEVSPDEPRALFYLAQSCQDNGMLDEAKKYYIKRLDVGGYEQEKYISLVRLGKMTKSYESLSYYIRATLQFPTRLEAYYHASWVLSALNLHMEAKEILFKGLRNKKESVNDLFVEWEVYNWLAEFQSAITLYYTSEFEEGFQIINTMLKNGKIPEYKIEFAKQQLAHFARNVSDCVTDLKYNTIVPQVLVIDNFLKNPDILRDFAMRQEYPVSGNYPGRRTKSFATVQHKLMFEKILQKNISYWPDGYNGTFQYVTKDMTTWFHRDLTKYSAILFLTPDPPSNTGSNIYKHKRTGFTYKNENADIDLEMNNDSNNKDAWVLTDKIENHYNRLVIFSGLKTHRADEYFGETIDDSRLFLIWFFD